MDLEAIGELLQEARKRSRCSGASLAARAGVSQPTVSRVESGQRVASVEAVEQLIAALPFSQEEAKRLTLMARDAYALASSEKRVDAGVSLVPGAGRKLLASASAVWGFQDAMVPAVLRVPEYATAAGGGAGSFADWDRVLADEGKSFRLVVTESALRTWPGSGEFMPAQLEHLAAVAERPNVSLGVIPWGVGLPVMPPHGFTVCDEAGVLVETFTAQMTLTGPEHVTPYREAFEALFASLLELAPVRHPAPGR
ncbi:Scr1 family TA system antitoxin-like transcriptional regulator [Nocardiopsis lambiniae]|uniref:Scr1 family TA system antitoxin-like transcriptional regulator n=1 Tax=Nocardiopsis lambiniae TaxID=3075539 RepID=A0ABU2ME69_9ACTN|nr:Scr1 family TA system antitoxin-like transcriptional regulator [Nocardiopsis sp. DSM 44743]MDT0330983.1 Scr1 family TA system antitoxin-like transcriptional regulator [Nocardiopsis sp. DSM 44743]